jgi:hypothetical protein
MRDPYTCEKRIQSLIFTTPIGLHDNDFSIQKMFNVLKHTKFRKRFRLVLQEKDPSQFGIIINETHVVFIIANRIRDSPPHTSENTSSRGAFDTLKDLENGN